MRSLAITLLTGLLSITVFAAETIRVQTVNPNVEVFDRPSFSGRVVERLKVQSVLEVTAKKVVGPDGIGAFYEFKNSSGGSVYISDSDVNPAPAQVAKPAPQVVPVAPVASAPIVPKTLPRKLTPATSANIAIPVIAAPTTTTAPLAETKPVDAPVTQTRAALTGINLGVVNYAEKYKDVRYQAARSLVGFNYQDYFGGSANYGFNFNLGFSPGAPKFLLDAGAQGASTGYLMMADLEFMANFFAASAIQLKFGLGASFISSKFNTTVISEPYSSESSRAGAVMSTGVSYNSADWTLLLDLRQHIEKESYLSSQIGILIPIRH